MEEILSVGIDIGTATTQVVFSKLTVENTAAAFSAPHADIVNKQVVYKGGIHTTPLQSPTLIDSRAVRQLVLREYGTAGIEPRQVRTGAAIVTGETACKSNAEAVLQELSGLAGDFVIYTAGPDLESVIAGKGSGAQSHSRQHNCLVANLDIGGGTTNIALFDCGKLVGRGCLDIGGRLIRLDSGGAVTYISPRAQLVVQALGIPVEVGKQADFTALRQVAARMNQVLEQALGFRPPDNLSEALVTPGSSRLAGTAPIDCLCFSGGVADCIGPPTGDPFRYGDIGVLLGEAIAQGLATKTERIGSQETIRATVIGAGTHTLSVSGSTISCDATVLPVRNLPVLCLGWEEEAALLEDGVQLTARKLRWFLEQSGNDNALIRLSHIRHPSYIQIQLLAQALAHGSDQVLEKGKPLLLASRADMAKALGQQADWQLKGARPVVSIDGVQLCEGDYVDIGSPLLGGLTVPVVVKTLLFGEGGRQ